MKLKKTALVLGLALLPLPALAHIHLHPETARAGQVVELSLIVGHGCAGAPTTGMRVALPLGLKDVVAVEKPGWQTSGQADQVGWQGGSLADGTKDSFVLRATLTDDAPQSIAIPIVQSCGEAQQRWIQDGADAQSPAPVLQVLPPE